MRATTLTNPKARLRAMLLCSIAALAPVATAQAQAADEGDAEEQAIVVTGARPIAESEAAALKVPRESDLLVTVPAPGSVGRPPGLMRGPHR